MSIKQLNASYLLQEDRILFRFNTHEDAEYRLWFTRRVTLFILAATSHLLEMQLEKTHSPEVAKAISQFEQAAIQDQLSNTATASAPEVYSPGSLFPIGIDPLLVMDVQCQLGKTENTKGGIDTISIDFLLPGGGKLNLKLEDRMLHALCVLLNHLATTAQWQIRHDPDAIKVEDTSDSEGPKKSPLH